MASLRVLDWNGRYLASSSSSSSSSSLNSNHQQHSCTGRTLSFPITKASKNFLADHKPHQQQMAQRHRLSTVAANRGGERMNETSNSFNLDHLIPSDHWTEISKVHRTHNRIVDKAEEDKAENLDQWMRDSVVQIVSNIGEAPFLVHIYNCEPEDDHSQRNEDSSSSSGIRLVVEKAIAESWPIIKGRWTKGGSPIPNGIILVEELKSKEVGVIMSSTPESDQTPNSNSNSNSNSGINVIDSQSQSTTKTWGLLIQAKGLNPTACYILKTCRVQTLLGFCTHFGLVRVECFVENAETQLNNLWLHR